MRLLTTVAEQTDAKTLGDALYSDGVVTTIKEAKTCPRAAKAGDRLRVHYEGRLDGPDGKMFDSSKERGNTFNFQLGAGQVITR